MSRRRGAHEVFDRQDMDAPPASPDGGAHGRSGAPEDECARHGGHEADMTPRRGAHEASEGRSAAGGGDVGAQRGDALQTPCEPDDLFRLVYRLIEDLQKVRLSHGNRVRQVLPLIPPHVSPPRGVPSWEVFFKTSAEVLEGEEARVLKLAARLLRDDPIGRWLLAQKGIGPSLAVSILGECWPLSRFRNPQKLWAYAGLHVRDGLGVKRRKGQRANWNARLKTRCWLFSQSILKAGGPWRDLYDARKVYEYQKVGRVFEAEMTAQQVCESAETQRVFREADAAGIFEEAGAQTETDAQGRIAPGLPDSVGAHDVADAGGAQARTDLHDSDVPADSEPGDAHPGPDTQTSRPLSRLHLHNRALRFVMKRLLRDLWVVAHAG